MSEKITAVDIVADYLMENGYDGLVDHDGACGCELDDLMPCGGESWGCHPGYKVACSCGEGCDFHISVIKP